MASCIEVHNVKRSFKSVKKEAGLKGALKLLIHPEHQVHEALKGVSFSIDDGAFVGLIGANGAGKTTLLKILSGLIPPTEGTARVMGYEPFKRTLDFRKRISLVMGQKAQLWWDLPAIDAFELLRAIYEIPRETYQKRVDELASLLDVTRLLNTQIRRLSLGERMKMELIGALLHWPDVIFLDEPTIGLDVFAAQKLREFLKTYNQRDHRTMILTSHNMDDIERLCSRILILQEGSLIYDGSPQALVGTKGEKRLRVRFSTEAPTVEELQQLMKLPLENICVGLSSEEKAEGSDVVEPEHAKQTVRFRVTPDQIAPVLQVLLQKYPVVDMGIEEQDLESFIHNLLSQEHKDRGLNRVSL